MALRTVQLLGRESALSSCSIAPLPSNEQGFALARDGTKLFVRSRTEGHAPSGAVRAILCDGIACDGFIWKYLWDDLAPTAPLTHWHYRGHGRSAAPAIPTGSTSPRTPTT